MNFIPKLSRQLSRFDHSFLFGKANGIHHKPWRGMKVGHLNVAAYSRSLNPKCEPPLLFICHGHSKFLLMNSLQNNSYRMRSDASQVADKETGISNQTTMLNGLAVADDMATSDEMTRKSLVNDMIVIEDFLSEEEEKSLLSEIEPYMKKLRYEFDHWDDAIHGYRETEKRHWNEANQAIIQRVRDLAFPPDVPEAQLAFVHILDLDKIGYIKPHVDSVRFCGSTITGISLLSDSVMRLVHVENKDSWANILLKRRSLYIMKGVARYQYTHEVLANDQSYYREQPITRHRRISVICRNEPTDLSGCFDDPKRDT